MQISTYCVLLVVVPFLVLLPFPVWSASIANNDNGFMDSLSTGFRFASKLLGMNQSASVASLVSQAFAGPLANNNAPKIANKQSQNYQYEDSEYSSNDKDNVVDKSESYSSQFNNIVEELRQPSGTTSTTTTTSSPAASLTGISSLLRVLGMDEKKLSALMVNGLIFIAQMVKNGASYLDQKLSPVRQALQRLIVRLPGSNTVTFAKE